MSCSLLHYKKIVILGGIIMKKIKLISSLLVMLLSFVVLTGYTKMIKRVIVQLMLPIPLNRGRKLLLLKKQP